jgi:hypothetical protein
MAASVKGTQEVKQSIAEQISESLLNWRDSDTLALAEVPLEDAEIPPIDKKKHLGLRIAMALPKRGKTFLDEYVKAVCLQLGEVGNELLLRFDYIEIMRIKADTEEDKTTVVEILEIQPKRQVGLW